ncbi:MAG: ABC transporter permease [Arachnia sp.]
MSRRGFRPLGLRELWREAYSSLVARPLRSVLTAAGTIIGVAALVAILGLASTANGQVSASFDQLAANTVTAKDSRPFDGEALGFPFTEQAIGRARTLNGVIGVGALYAPSTMDQVRGPSPRTSGAQAIPIVAASSTIWEAVGATGFRGRGFDAALADTPVAVLGSGAAANLDIRGFVTPTAIEIGERPFTVVGILDDVERHPELRMSVIIPIETAIQLWGDPTATEAAELIVATRQGAATQVAKELVWAVSPGAPTAITVEEPPDPRTLRESVSGTLQGLLLGLGTVSLVIGTFGIANSTLVSVMERRTEIGLRRALGASKGDIARQVALESALLGVLGGLVGATVGMYAVIVVAAVKDWSPIVNLELLFIAPAIGAVTGLLAGAYPAFRAAGIEPAQALRST